MTKENEIVLFETEDKRVLLPAEGKNEISFAENLIKIIENC